MVESIGICEKHLLPLDENGECELCRLSEMPSKAPPARGGRWAVIISVVVVLLGAAWAYFSVASGGELPAAQGVQPVTPSPEPARPVAPEQERPAPVRVPPRSTPPRPEDIPTPDDFER